MDRPARGVVARQAREKRGDRACFVAPRRLRRSGGPVVGRAEQHGHPRAVGLQPVRLHPLVARLATRLLLVVEEAGEHVVDPAQDRRRRAEVLADGLDASASARLRPHQVLDLVVHGDVSPAEAVDGLLGVAHHEELAGLEHDPPPRVGLRPALAEEEDDLRLERIGVLELVDQEIAEAPLQQSPRVAIGEEQVAQAAEEVGEVEAPQSELGAAGPARERVRDGDGEAG